MKFQEMVKKNELSPCQVYNIDETGLNYKMLQNKTLAASNETVVGMKLKRDRLTVALCSDIDGTHELPLFVTGKDELSSLPVYYLN